MVVGDGAVERRVVEKIGPVINRFDVPRHAVDIAVFAGFEEPPPGDRIGTFEVQHGRSLPYPVGGRQTFSRSRG